MTWRVRWTIARKTRPGYMVQIVRTHQFADFGQCAEAAEAYAADKVREGKQDVKVLLGEIEWMPGGHVSRVIEHKQVMRASA